MDACPQFIIGRGPSSSPARLNQVSDLYALLSKELGFDGALGPRSGPRLANSSRKANAPYTDHSVTRDRRVSPEFRKIDCLRFSNRDDERS